LLKNYGVIARQAQRRRKGGIAKWITAETDGL
jgi:hypothetical protein